MSGTRGCEVVGGLTPLESAVAAALARQLAPTDPQSIMAQLESAEVVERTFTALGFFTDLKADRRLPPLSLGNSQWGWVESRVGSQAYSLNFMLLIRNGFVEQIEAFSMGDGYGDLDLLTATFTPPEPVTPQTK